MSLRIEPLKFFIVRQIILKLKSRWRSVTAVSLETIAVISEVHKICDVLHFSDICEMSGIFSLANLYRI